jgi:hypothetical protein
VEWQHWSKRCLIKGSIFVINIVVETVEKEEKVVRIKVNGRQQKEHFENEDERRTQLHGKATEVTEVREKRTEEQFTC